jgi:transposase InsO family protein
LGGSKGRRIAATDKATAIYLLTKACNSGARKHKACEVLGFTVRSFQRWLKKDNLDDGRNYSNRIPGNKLTEIERNKIIEVSTLPEYRDLAIAQIVPTLADQGSYIASESSFYRVLKEHNLNTYRGKSKPRTIRKKPELIAPAPNYIWSWDITYLQTVVKGMFYYLYLIMDIYSRKIVGFDIFAEQAAELASVVITEACNVEGINKSQLTLHADNGSPMKGSVMLATLQKLGVIPSFSRASVSNDNAYSEALFKTLKYCPEYPSKPFTSIDQAKAWVTKFVYWYNNIHHHSGIKFVTPHERHEGLDRKILSNRISVYEKARSLNPNRWSKQIRNWSIITSVGLNYNTNKKAVSV